MARHLPVTENPPPFHQTVRINPHVAQIHAPPLPITVRPISNSPQHLTSSRMEPQNRSSHSVSHYHHVVHQPQPLRPQNITQMQNIKRSSAPSVKYGANVQYLSIEGVRHEPPPTSTPRNQTSNSVVGSSRQPMIQIRQSPVPLHHHSMAQSPRVVVNAPLMEKKSQSPQNKKITKVKQAYILEHQTNDQLKPNHFDYPVEQAQSQTILQRNFQESRAKSSQIRQNQSNVSNQENLKKSTNSKGDMAYVKVYRSMEEYLKQKNQSNIQKKQEQIQNGYLMSFNGNEVKGSQQQKQPSQNISSQVSPNYNRSHLSNISHHQQSSKNQNKQSQLRHIKNESQLKNQEVNQLIRRQKPEHQYQLRQVHQHQHYWRHDGNGIEGKTVVSTHNIAEKVKVQEDRGMKSFMDIKMQVDKEGDLSGSSFSITNQEDIDMYNVRLMIEEIYNNQLKIGMAKINETYQKALTRINIV